jgi:hypothetical protein
MQKIGTEYILDYRNSGIGYSFQQLVICAGGATVTIGGKEDEQFGWN